MDVIKILTVILVLCKSYVKCIDCPPHTVEIVFTKHGIICATTTSVPELKHLSIDPKVVPEIIGAGEPIVHKMSQPFMSFGRMIDSPEALIEHMPALMAAQSAPPHSPQGPQSPSEYMPIYHENVINQNESIDRRPDLTVEDKTTQYQRMLWHKLIKEFEAKRVSKMLNHNNDNQNVYTVDESSDHSDGQGVRAPIGEQSSDDNQSPPSIQSQTLDNWSQKLTTIPSKTRHSSESGITGTDDKNSVVVDKKETKDRQLLKEYLNYLKSKDTEQKEPSISGQHEEEVIKTDANNRVPDIIRGFMPSAPPPAYHGYSGLQVPLKGPEEMVASHSQHSYLFNEFPHQRYYSRKSLDIPLIQSTDSLRLVGSGLSFGHKSRGEAEDLEEKPFGYRHSHRTKVRLNSRHIDSENEPLVENGVGEEVVLVTAHPQQRLLIERLEAEEQKLLNSRQKERHFLNRNYRNRKHLNIDNNWINSEDNGEDEDRVNDKSFRLNTASIEYNGWKPIRDYGASGELKARRAPEDRDEDMSALSSQIVRSIEVQPIIGRVSNTWKGVNTKGYK